MAIEEKGLLEVETGDSGKKLIELREAVKGAKKALDDAVVGSTDFAEKQKALLVAQNALTNATKLGTAETKKAGDSYNALSRTMAELKQQYHSVTDAVKREELAKEIKAINDRLKAMDSEVGVFTRNVGNYASALEKGFSGAGGAAAGLIGPINGVKAGFTALSANPIITILGFAINLFYKVTRAMKSSEEGSQALAKAFDGFKVIADLMTKGLQLVGEGFVWVAEGITTLLKKMGILKDKSEERIELGQAEIELAKEQRRVTMENADAELKISKLRAQATDKINLSASKRLELLKEAGELEKKVSENNYNLAKQEYELIKAKNALLPSSSQEMQEEADAYAKMVNAETAYFNKQREYNSQMAEAFNQAKTEAKELKEEIGGLVDIYEGSEDRLNEYRLKKREEFARDQAVIEEELLEFEEDWAKDMMDIADGKAKYDKRLADKEKKWQEDKYNYMGSLMSSAAKLAGENSAIGKALAVANTTIDTYRSATAAYASQLIPGDPSSVVRGTIAAAAAVASGLANVKAILATKTDGKSTSMPAVGATMMTAAPAVIQQVPVMRSLTGASEDERLNAIADNTGQTASRPIKAYVVQSEMEGEQLYADTRNRESSF